MTPVPERSVVVVSYRPGSWLEPCLRSVLDQAAQVVVVDNGSPGARAAAIARGLGAEAVVSETNRGFTGGVAMGLRRARGEVVALLNDDAVAAPGWLDTVSSLLEREKVAAVAPKVTMSGWYRPVTFEDPAWSAPGDDRPLGRQVRSVLVGGRDRLGDVGGAGIHRLETSGAERWRWTAGPVPFWVPVGDDPGAEISIDGEKVPAGPAARLVNSAGTYLRADGYAGDHGLMAPDAGQFEREKECFAASGVALATTAKVLRDVGGLAGGYFAYYEDIDWCWRARLLGYRIVYTPHAGVEHHRGATSGGEAAESVRRLAERNRTITIVRNAPRGVAARHLSDRLRDGSDRPVRAAVLRRLPGALAWRARSAPRWRVSPEEVWRRWAGTDCEWEQAGGGGDPAAG